mmetsp:Transcript_60818/g.51500  ORF Transcript_60818/g.51500 Transcript_60818/m.51500 type:complete len:142 (+) Transcript_60818:1285-1710(+)
MFTGDREPCARRVAAFLDIPHFEAGMIPARKKAALEALRFPAAANSSQELSCPNQTADCRASGQAAALPEQHVLFVGDGVNDAQAISAASIGVAIDTKNVLTCESADVVILGSDLRNLVYFVELSRAAFAIIKQNYFWALV